MRTPHMGLRHVLPGSGILRYKFAPRPFSLYRSALLHRLEFGIKPSGSRQKFEELVAQIRLFKPVLPQERFPSRFVMGFHP